MHRALCAQVAAQAALMHCQGKPLVHCATWVSIKRTRDTNCVTSAVLGGMLKVSVAVPVFIALLAGLVEAHAAACATRGRFKTSPSLLSAISVCQDILPMSQDRSHAANVRQAGSPQAPLSSSHVHFANRASTKTSRLRRNAESALLVVTHLNLLRQHAHSVRKASTRPL